MYPRTAIRSPDGLARLPPVGDHGAVFDERVRLRRTGIACTLACLCALAGCSVTVAGTPTADRANAGPPASTSPSSTPQPTSATPTTAPTGSRFTDAAGRFAIVAPSGWRVDTSGSQGTAVIFLDRVPTPSAAGPFSSNINVLLGPAGGASLTAAVLVARQELRKLNEYSTTADESFVLGDGTEAQLLGGTFTDAASGSELRNLQLFTVYDDSTIVVTATALAAAWSRYDSTFEASLRTLTVVT